MQRDGFKCVACGKSDETLSVHHGRYDYRGGKFAPWATDNKYLQTLCGTCHCDIGHHPKAGVMYAEGEYGIEVVVMCCPDCGSDGWKDKGEYQKCTKCGRAVGCCDYPRVSGVRFDPDHQGGAS